MTNVALRGVILLGLAVVACGAPEGGRDGGTDEVDDGGIDAAQLLDAGPPGCTSDAECDDGVDCTADTCTSATGACRHQVVPALCPAGSSCHPVRGCEMGRPCATDADCADDDACTTNERCDPAARVCVVDPLDGDGDGDPPRVCGGMDCDDSRSTVYAGAPELCNTVDDDCDGTIDEGLETPVCAYCQGRASCEPGYTTTACYVDVTRVVDFLECTNRGDVSAAIGECEDGGCLGQTACIRTALATCTCPPPRTFCPGDGTGVGLGCMDLMTSPWDCGACGNACGAGMDCVAGSCRCPTGQTLCADACIDTLVDPVHCGGCGSACPAGANCGAGTCVCPPGETACGPACVDTSSDAANCGTCGHRCPFGVACSGGTCLCPAGTTECPATPGDGPLCADLASDERNCGACGNACPRGLTCTGGICGCPSGTTFCDGWCVDVSSDPTHCGGCGVVCGSGRGCVAGACVCPAATPWECNGSCHGPAGCDPITSSGCPATESCNPVLGCRPAGSGVAGTPCRYHEDCLRGLFCLGTTLDDGICTILCCGPGDDARCRTASLGGSPGATCATPMSGIDLWACESGP